MDPGPKEHMLGLNEIAWCLYSQCFDFCKHVSITRSSRGSRIRVQRTFRHVLGLLNAFVNLAFVLDVSFGGEGFVKARTKVVVA